jgi:hypothetical protein
LKSNDFSLTKIHAAVSRALGHHKHEVLPQPAVALSTLENIRQWKVCQEHLVMVNQTPYLH